MHPYIPHLLADITAAHRTEIPEENEVHQNAEEYFEAIDKWLSGEEPDRSFGYYCGLDPINFPPADQLTDEEMIIIRKAFEKMMATWNYGIDLPENLPVAFAYNLIVNSLNQETTLIDFGCMHFDICSGYAPDCELKEYCPCWEFWDETSAEDMDTDLNKEELPF